MSLFRKVMRFASSPQGQMAIRKAKQMAQDPKNKQKIDDLKNKVLGGSGGSSSGTTSSADPNDFRGLGGQQSGGTSSGPTGSQGSGSQSTGSANPSDFQGLGDQQPRRDNPGTSQS
ncbi:hypothetical protein GIY23_15905 [Allosaccharopolyspora coralli]|uniref:Uncharacterized protein n=1 Tax=Allosaccharopolyspora coralli TaxID=2665642 RepID=A0A5Q3QAB2_9PSEU|nr:hypothetical protein [Allosaccharopolyspora coralli]QGK70800.1 hypothetical protein GIY23_15905 [Allosaccharopolyspora coralli]